jgi:hypothetical protein
MAKGANMAAKRKKPGRAATSQEPDPMAVVVTALALQSNANAAAVIQEYAQPFGEQSMEALMAGLAVSIEQVQNGDMKRCEAMLMAQAHALQSIFMNFSRRTLTQKYQKHLESFMRMALKAQNQCRMTLETLATIKNPPVVFAQQANIAHGHQQVNNGIAASAHAGECVKQSNELLEAQHEQRLDSGTAGAATGHDPAMATVGKIHRPAHG